MMDMFKLSLCFFMLVVGFVSSKRHHIPSDTFDKLVKRYENYLDAKDAREKVTKDILDDKDLWSDIDNKDLWKDIDKKETLSAAVDADGNGNRDTCDATGITCHYCQECHPGGWCVTGKNNKPYCICKHGWTGPHAVYVTTQNPLFPPEGRNRVFADNCDTACHYTHDFRGRQCAGECLVFNCKQDDDKQCPDCKNGKCDKKTGRCVCCRGWTGPNGVYDTTKNAYVADTCDTVCHYLGDGVDNVGCKAITPIDDCDPLCLETEGKCIKETGKCECCYGWTGPNAKLVNDRIHADYCDVYCPYTKENIELKCVNPNYVKRLPKIPTLLVD